MNWLDKVDEDLFTGLATPSRAMIYILGLIMLLRPAWLEISGV